MITNFLIWTLICINGPGLICVIVNLDNILTELKALNARPR